VVLAEMDPCVAVMVVDPTLTAVAVLPAIVATARLLELQAGVMLGVVLPSE
jgi:hypothetical protein